MATTLVGCLRRVRVRWCFRVNDFASDNFWLGVFYLDQSGRRDAELRGLSLGDAKDSEPLSKKLGFGFFDATIRRNCRSTEIVSRVSSDSLHLLNMLIVFQSPFWFSTRSRSVGAPIHTRRSTLLFVADTAHDRPFHSDVHARPTVQAYTAV